MDFSVHVSNFILQSTKKIILILLTAVLFTLNIPAVSFAYGEVVGSGIFDLVDITLPDTPQILLNTPPEISASDINLGEDLYINVSSSGYAAVINSVTLNGQSISKGSGGYNIYTSMMNFTYLRIDHSNFTSPGYYTIVLQADGYYDADCTVKAIAQKPPVLTANPVTVGEKPVISTYDLTYTAAVTTILGPVLTTYELKDGDFSIVKGNIIINSPAPMAGGFPLKIIATGYEDASITVNVSKLPAVTVTAKDIAAGEFPVFDTDDSVYAKTVTKVTVDGTTYDTSDLTVKGDEITLKKAMDSAGTKAVMLASYSYENSACVLNVAAKTALTSTAPAITGISADPKQLSAGGGYVSFTLTGTNLKQAKSILVDANGRQAQAILPATSNDTVVVGLNLPANNTAKEQSYKFSPVLDGVTQKVSATVKVAANTGIDSGVFQIGKADSWALPEVNGASSLDLLPDILSGKDLTKPMTREEFCELSVRLYEKMTGKQVTPADSDTFNDTDNAQVLKAYALGITSGTSTSSFDPDTQINREQCATMLFRTIKLIKPNGDYNVASVKAFPDINSISSWAVDATKYMNKIAIIKGDSTGNFMPKPMTSGQISSGYGMAKREETILMVTRTYSQLSN